GLDGMREDAHRLIVRALAAAGRRAEALKHYQHLVALLKRELNTEPDAATMSLVAELRSTEGPSATPPVAQIAKPVPSDRKKLPPFAVEGAEPKADVKSPAQRSDAASPVVLARSASPERRQLTIMACSMVGPPLSPSLDPEDARDLIVTFHKA